MSNLLRLFMSLVALIIPPMALATLIMIGVLP